MTTEITEPTKTILELLKDDNNIAKAVYYMQTGGSLNLYTSVTLINGLKITAAWGNIIQLDGITAEWMPPHERQALHKEVTDIVIKRTKFAEQEAEAKHKQGVMAKLGLL